MSTIEFTIQEVRDLVQGKFSFGGCLDCSGRGYVHVDDTLGITVTAPNTDDPTRYSTDQCDSCKGIGGFIKWQ